jgi:hypothetical protein
MKLIKNKKKRNIIFILCLFCMVISCSKTEKLSPETVVPTTLSTTNVKVPFSSKSEKYSKINETTGLIVNQNNFYRYITQAEAQLLQFGNKPMYRFGLRDAVTYDFNGDGRLDLFGFCTRFELFPEVGDLGRAPSKFILINDFYSGTKEYKVIDTDLCWIAGSFLLNDFNGDGKMEVAVFNSNGHQNVIYGINNPLIPVRIYSIDAGFNVTYKNVGNPLNMHSGTTGDIDNDGDIDIVQWPLNLGRGIEPVEFRYPYVLLNDGNGNFKFENFLSDYTEFKSKFYDWSTSIYELFDLNNDNKLDLIFGYNFGNVPKVVDPWNPSYDIVNKKIGILWGDGSGKFNSSNVTFLSLNSLQNLWLSLSGASFTDFDTDGDIDVLLASTTGPSKAYILFLLENKGNKVFEDVTSKYLEGSSELDNTYYTHFYQPMFVDKDGDGDFDIVPNLSTAAWESYKVISNLYWEKQGKNFIRRNLNN